jgi:hypothetical protein
VDVPQPNSQIKRMPSRRVPKRNIEPPQITCPKRK